MLTTRRGGAVILVVGATGLVGGQVCRRLLARGRPVRALVRAGSPRAAELGAAGADVAQGDLKDPASLAAACRGVETVVSTASSTLSRRAGDGLETVDRDGQLALVEAARTAAAKRFVFTSVSPRLPEVCALVRYKRQVEKAIRASGMTWTVLQPSMFMDVWFGPALGWDVARGRARVFGDGTARFSYVSVADVAEFATRAAVEDVARNRDLPLGGPEPVAQIEAVRTFEELSGRRFTVQKVPRAVLRTMSVLLRPVAPIPAALMAMGAFAARHGDAIDMAPVLKDIPVPLTSVRQYARQALGLPSE